MNQLIKIFFVFILSFILFNQTVKAQDDLLNMLDSVPEKSEKVFATFKTTRVVNAHSVETVKKKALDFRITHHFGSVSGNSGGVHKFFGLDNAEDIRIAFEYGVTDRFTIGVGRSKVGEMIDGYLKFRLLQQTSDNKMPVSATLFTNAAITPSKSSAKEYDNFSHRLSYTYQAIVGRKFGSRFSLQLMPTLVHRNYLFNRADENDLLSLGAGARLKLSKRFAILADYFHIFSDYRKNNKKDFFPPLGIGAEIETGGHVFHMFFTNNGGIIENSFIPNSTDSWGKGEFKFGFNISRTFGIGKSNK